MAPPPADLGSVKIQERIAWVLFFLALGGVMVLMMLAGYAIITHLPTPEPHYGH